MRENPQAKTKLGFTLIELMVVVTIIGLLGSIAIPSYQKAIKHSHLSGALEEMRKLYDMEHAFAYQSVTTDPTGGTPPRSVECERRKDGQFMTVCMLYYPPGGIGPNFGGYLYPPPGKKGPRRFIGYGWTFWYGTEISGVTACGFDEATTKNFGDPKPLGMVPEIPQFDGEWDLYPSLPPSYFLIRASRDGSLAAAQGVEKPWDAISVHAIADFDGDHGTTGISCAAPPYSDTSLTILSRGLYFKSGEAIGLPGIVRMNMYE